MKRILYTLLLLFVSMASYAFDSAFWADIQKFPVPEYRWGEKEDGIKARQIYYRGENYKGNPTEVFAYYCTPGILKGDPSLDKNLPAVVCLHGGGGRAFAEWVELWASRGYAAIAMDWSGNGSELFYKNPTEEQKKKISAYGLQKRVHMKNGGPDKTHETVSLEDGKAEKDAWAYQAVGAITRAHSLIRSFKEINPEKTALTGISWGGYLTSLTSGIDQRFKAAVPVYGCGFLYEYHRWYKNMAKGSPTEGRWIALFDPSKSLEVTKVPMLFVNSPRDPWYPLSIWTKSVDAAHAQACLISNLGHSHPAGWAPAEIEAFIASKLYNKTGLPVLGKIAISGQNASCNFKSETKIESASLFYTEGAEKPDWHIFKWKSVPAEMTSGKISAKIPEGARAIYFSVKDERGLQSSSNAVILIP